MPKRSPQSDEAAERERAAAIIANLGYRAHLHVTVLNGLPQPHVYVDRAGSDPARGIRVTRNTNPSVAGDHVDLEEIRANLETAGISVDETVDRSRLD